MHSTPSQQERILKDAKFPSSFITARYTTVREAVTRFLTASPRDPAILTNKMELLKIRLNDPSIGDWERQDCELSYNAINAFALNHNLMNLNKTTFSAGDPHGKRMSIQGVEVNVRPDLIVPPFGVSKKTGAALLRPQKGDNNATTRAETGKTGASLLHYFLSETRKDGVKVDPKSCLVIDVMYGEVHEASAAYKRRISDIQASCRTIAARWKDIKQT